MRKIGLVLSLAAATSLGACAGITPAQISATVSSYEAEVQADANLVCGFIPTVGTILSLIPAVGAIEPAAAAVANALCNAIASAPVPTASARFRSLKGGVPATVGSLTVSGVGVSPIKVPIVGTFTR